MMHRTSTGHTRAFDLDLLGKIGMDVDFARFGMRLDGMVLCPLRRMVLVSSPSSFFALFGRWTMVFLSDFFGVERYFNWRNFSHLLGFSARLPVFLAKACRDFDRHEFWILISGQVVHGKFAPRCNDIQNPTLCSMHKWVILLFV